MGIIWSIQVVLSGTYIVVYFNCSLVICSNIQEELMYAFIFRPTSHLSSACHLRFNLCVLNALNHAVTFVIYTTFQYYSLFGSCTGE